ncbi:MAG: hypothetical protein ACREHG_03035 [Candidatus Saccharimonadales bacterium]
MTNHDTQPNPQLPKFEPRGMGKGDKIAMWVLIFIVVLFGLSLANAHLGTNATDAKPHPAATVTVKPKPIATDAKSTYVVVNSANGYLWWLDNNGGPFTYSSATKFIVGHHTYHIYVLKRDG